jgi:hypothetical protein
MIAEWRRRDSGSRILSSSNTMLNHLKMEIDKRQRLLAAKKSC